MADIQKFVDRAGVSTLWGQVAAKVQAEADRALAAEQANTAATYAQLQITDAFTRPAGTYVKISASAIGKWK